MKLHDMTQLCEQTEADAWTEMIAAAPAEFAHQFGMSVRRFGSITALSCPGIGAMLFNRVIGLGVDEPASEKQIDEIIAYYADRGFVRFAFQIRPNAQIENWLTARGFTRGDDWVKVYRSDTPTNPMNTDLRVEQVTPDQHEVFARTLCLGYGLPEILKPFASGIVNRPGWYTYMSYDSDQPVGTGALYINKGIGWLGAGATLPMYRRRGGQAALMTRRIQDGMALGCTWFVTETDAERPDHPNPSYHNMLRTGFKTGYLRANYLSPAL